MHNVHVADVLLDRVQLGLRGTYLDILLRSGRMSLGSANSTIALLIFLGKAWSTVMKALPRLNYGRSHVCSLVGADAGIVVLLDGGSAAVL